MVFQTPCYVGRICVSGSVSDAVLRTFDVYMCGVISDALAFELTYSLFPGNFSSALLDKSSYEFRSRSFEFCKDVSWVRALGWVGAWFGWVDGWIEGWMDKWMDGWMDWLVG